MLQSSLNKRLNSPSKDSSFDTILFPHHSWRAIVSVKGKDIQRDDRYPLHCSVEDSNGGEGEFYVRGHA
jgi:hypothetical protein